MMAAIFVEATLTMTHTHAFDVSVRCHYDAHRHIRPAGRPMMMPAWFCSLFL